MKIEYKVKLEIKLTKEAPPVSIDKLKISIVLDTTKIWEHFEKLNINFTDSTLFWDGRQIYAELYFEESRELLQSFQEVLDNGGFVFNLKQFEDCIGWKYFYLEMMGYEIISISKE